MTSSISVGFFSPSSLTGCVLWLDGSSLALSNGATVSTWPSLGPVSYTTTSTAGRFPTYASNVQNGRGAVQYATGQTSVLSNFVLSQTMSVFQLSYPIGQAIHPFFEHSPDENANPGFYMYSSGGNNFAINSGSGQVAVNVGNIGATNTWLLQEGLNKDPNAGNTMGYYSNATLVASNGVQNGTTPVTNTLFLNGRNNTNPLSYPAYVAEVIVYSNALNNFGRQQIEGYLAWKWGLTSLLPTSHPYKNLPYFILTESIPRTIPMNTLLVPINTFSTIKTFTLPTVSTNSGRILILKDYLGYAGSNNIRLSTLGLDRIERSNVSSMTLSNAYGAWWFMNDGLTKWFLTDAYLNNFYLLPPVSTPPIVSRGLTQNLDAATYTSGSTWTALVGNNDILYNTPTTTTAPGGQTVLVFNGTNQYAMDQTGTNITTFSFDVWFYASANGMVVSEMGQSGAPNNGYHVATFNLVSGTIRVGFWTGGATSISLGSYTTNKWTQVSWTYTSGTLIGYVNGVYVATGSQTKSPPATSYYAIAAQEDTSFGNNAYFNGRIGAYKLYNVVLTADEVKQNYNAFANSRYGLPTI
jgi:hypothetical protein